MTRRDWTRLAVGAASLRTAGAQSARRMDKPGPKHQPEPALAELLNTMRGLVERRDAPGLIRLMNPRFRVEFDSGKGPAAFQQYWKPQSKESRLWSVMSRLIDLDGYEYSETLYVKPYAYARFPIDLDPLQHVVAVKDEVELREAASIDAKSAGQVGREILRLEQRASAPVVLGGEWLSVTTFDGRKGHVRCEDVYSPAGHRMYFEKRAGKWVWISLACASFRGAGERG